MALNFNTNANGQNKWQAALGQGGTAAPAAPAVSAPPVQAPSMPSAPHYTTNYTGGAAGLAKDPTTGLNQFQQNQQNSQAAAAAAGGYKPPTTAPMTSPVQSPTTTPVTAPVTAPTTNYGGKGNPLNEILFSKEQYDAGNKNWAANNAQQYYGQLDPNIAKQVQGMNTEQLKAYIASQGSAPVQAPGSTYNPNGGQTAPSGINDIQYNPNDIFTPGSNGGYDPAAEEKAFLQQQLDALNAQNQSNLSSTNYQIDQNKQALQQQLDALNKQNVVQTDATQQFNNRLGGLYSGGQQYQQGEQAAAYANQQGQAQQQTSAKNQQLLDQYGTQAASIASQIQTLQTASPDIIRERLQSWINNERDYGLNYANTFGNLNGQNTQSQNQQNFQQGIDVANLTGQYNGQTTLAGQQAALANKQANWNAYQDTVNQTGNLGKGPAENWSNLITNANTGVQTLAGSQTTLGNLWTAANATGTIGKDLAHLIGVPEGTKTEQALEFAKQNAQSSDDNMRQWAQLGLNFSKAQNGGGTSSNLGQAPSSAQAGNYLQRLLTTQVDDGNGGTKPQVASDYASKEKVFESAYDTLFAGTDATDKDVVNALVAAGFTPADIASIKKKYPKDFQGASSSGGGSSSNVKVPQSLSGLSSQYGKELGIDSGLIDAVAQQESGYGSASQNVMQVNGMSNSTPEESLKKGASMLANYMDQTGGNIEMSLAMYNMGPGIKSWMAKQGISDVRQGMQAFSDYQKQKLGVKTYGDPSYIDHVMRYYGG